MSTELSTQPSAADTLALLRSQQSKYADKTALATVTKAGSYLPYMQAMGSNSPEVQRGDMPMGVFALAKGKTKINLGKAVIAMLLSWRPKAMQFKPDVLSYFNPNTDEFKKLIVQSDVPNSGAAYGPEFLMWLPEYNEFTTMFFGNPTGRQESPNMIAALDSGNLFARLNCELIEYKKQKKSYHGTRYYKYDVPVTNLPPNDQLADILNGFNNPPETDNKPAEKAEEGDDGRG